MSIYDEDDVIDIRMDCIDIIEIVISLDCVIDDLYDLVIIFKYIIVMRN